MSDFTIARPYAKATFELAQTGKQLASWHEGIEILAAIVADKRVADILGDPRHSRAQHAQMLLDLAADKLPDAIKTELENLVRVLGDNKRLLLLPAIARLFTEFSDRAQNKVQLDISSAYKLDAATKKAIVSAVGAKLGKTLEVSTSVDKSLIGGVVIRAGDQVIDASIKNRIAQLGAALVK